VVQVLLRNSFLGKNQGRQIEYLPADSHTSKNARTGQWRRREEIKIAALCRKIGETRTGHPSWEFSLRQPATRQYLESEF
jgi:hypothetical protein